MKKKGVRLLACAAALSMVFVLGACSSQEGGGENSTEQPSIEPRKPYASLKEYVNSDEAKAELDTARSSAKDKGMNIDMRADGDKLIFSYQYLELVKEEGMEKELEQGLTEQADVFKNIAKELKEGVSVEEPVIVIEYLDANGELMHSQEFTAD